MVPYCLLLQSGGDDDGVGGADEGVDVDAAAEYDAVRGVDVAAGDDDGDACDDDDDDEYGADAVAAGGEDGDDCCADDDVAAADYACGGDGA